MIDFKSQARDIQDECGTSWTKFKKALKNCILSKGPKGKPEVLFLVISEKFQSTVAMVIVAAIIILIKLINTTN